jgi:transaldolase
MPPQTLQAFADHGAPQRTVDAGLDAARADLQAIAAAGISLDQVTEELETDGVKKFADSFEQLLSTIEERRRQLMTA